MNINFPLNDNKNTKLVADEISGGTNNKDTQHKSKKKKIQNELLLNSLGKIYKKKLNIKLITNIVNGNSKISLRLIDWFVTNYCKKNVIFITKMRYKTKEEINIYTDYRSQLKAYSKQLFDPFRRRERINFYFDNKEYLKTTVGQLNFFRWAIENNIIKYIEDNLNVIEQDMITSQKDNLERKNDKKNLKTKTVTTDKGNEVTVTRKKRNELSKSRSKHISHIANKRIISFD